MRNELAKVKASHEDEVKELRCTVEERDKKFEAMRTLWDKDRDDLRRLRDEIQKLQKQNEDLVQENEKLREESEDFMEQERQEKDLARPLIHLHHRLKSQCEEFGHHFADLLWKPAQPRELRILSKLAEYNKELRTKMDLAEGSSPRQQCVDLVTLFKNHRDWEFATMKELVQNSSKLGQAKAVAKDDLPQTLVGNDALMKTGTAARLGFWERSKQEHPWTLCENLFRLEQPFLVDTGMLRRNQMLLQVLRCSRVATWQGKIISKCLEICMVMTWSLALALFAALHNFAPSSTPKPWLR